MVFDINPEALYSVADKTDIAKGALKDLSAAQRAYTASLNRQEQIIRGGFDRAVRIYNPKQILQLLQDYQRALTLLGTKNINAGIEQLEGELSYVQRILKMQTKDLQDQYNALLKTVQEAPENLAKIESAIKGNLQLASEIYHSVRN